MRKPKIHDSKKVSEMEGNGDLWVAQYRDRKGKDWKKDERRENTVTEKAKREA